MIFVICGIMILIISFIIALVSLVREQEKHQEQIGYASNLRSDLKFEPEERQELTASEIDEQIAQQSDSKIRTTGLHPWISEASGETSELLSTSTFNESESSQESDEKLFPWEKDQRLSGEFSLKDIKDRQ